MNTVCGILVLLGVAVETTTAGEVGVTVGKVSGIFGTMGGSTGKRVGVGVRVGVSGTNTKAGVVLSVDAGE